MRERAREQSFGPLSMFVLENIWFLYCFAMFALLACVCVCVLSFVYGTFACIYKILLAHNRQHTQTRKPVWKWGQANGTPEFNNISITLLPIFFCISLPFNCPLSFASHRRRKIRFPSEKLKFTRWRSWKKDDRRFSRKCQEMTNVENRMGHGT